MAQSIRESLPPSYRHIFGEFFDRPKVVEARATCEKCSMCDHGQAAPVSMEFFNPDTKCCTFTPNLPNYLVGAILADESPEQAEGRRRIRATIASRIGVAPQYLSRPRKTSLILSRYGEGFGRAKSLLCPYYDASNPEGACTIWRHRETVCMTYYCKYSAGLRGFEYWVALRKYLGFVQRALSISAAKAIDRTVIEPVFKDNALTLEDIEDLPPKDSDYKAWWGNWVGREEEFYLKCHEWVRGLDPQAFARNVDESKSGQEALKTLIAKYEVLESKVLPTHLIRNPRMKETHVGDKVVVTSYHRFDSFSLDKDLFEVLEAFKADQSLAENLERLKREEGIELEPELIDFLFAAGVLAEPRTSLSTDGNDSRGKADASDLNGRRAALGAVLEARGIDVDDAARDKFNAGDAAKLELWIKKAAVASSIDDILSD
jgi:hypothetical protein